MVNDIIRGKILQVLYEAERRDSGRPVHSDNLAKELDTDIKDLTFHVNYLEGKKLVKVTKYLGTDFHVRITHYGIDEVEK